MIEKRQFTIWLLSALLIIATLPTINLIFSDSNSISLDAKSLFNTDTAEGLINFQLYKNGISGDLANTVVGKSEWLFLGNEHANTLNNARGLASNQTNAKTVHATVSELQRIQRYLEKRGIKLLFAIAPNKHSIYTEFLPDWLPNTNNRFTDEFTYRAKQLSLNAVDLRPTLVSHKSGERLLYKKSDSHWTAFGAYLAYNQIIDAINEQHKMNILRLPHVESVAFMMEAGDLTRFLKIKHLLGPEYEHEFYYKKRHGEPSMICISSLNRGIAIQDGLCELVSNRGVTVNSSPKLVTNPTPLNRQSLLWIRDSFGNANSPLFHETFSKTWEFHYSQLKGEQLIEFIEENNPEIVLYQIAERSIFNMFDG